VFRRIKRHGFLGDRKGRSVATCFFVSKAKMVEV